MHAYSRQSGKVGSPSALIDDFVSALTKVIEELTRPVDTIKHQAKTVTVGISRSDEGIIDRALVQAVIEAGAGRDVLSYRTLKVLADLDPAVAAVRGYTRYGVDGDSISVIDRGGVARGLVSRVDATLCCVAPSIALRPRARFSSVVGGAMAGHSFSCPR